MNDTLNMLGVWVAALLTLALYSFLYRENPIYRFAEFLYVGLGAGHGIVVTVDNYIRPTIKNTLIRDGRWIYLVPIIIGLLIYTRYIKSIAYFSRWTMAFFLGVGSGVVLTRDFKPFFTSQITATFRPLWVAGRLSTSLNNILLVVGVIATLSYFFFTSRRTGFLDYSARLGRWVMMLAFGAAFGNTVMARVSLFLGRVQFLLGEWLHLIKG
jgi:hypothetical protein